MQRGRSTMQAEDVVDDNNDQQTYVCREAAKQLRPLKLTSFLSARIRSPPSDLDPVSYTHLRAHET